jgi:hypothetical protein
MIGKADGVGGLRDDGSRRRLDNRWVRDRSGARE